MHAFHQSVCPPWLVQPVDCLLVEMSSHSRLASCLVVAGLGCLSVCGGRYLNTMRVIANGVALMFLAEAAVKPSPGTKDPKTGKAVSSNLPKAYALFRMAQRCVPGIPPCVAR